MAVYVLLRIDDSQQAKALIKEWADSGALAEILDDDPPVVAGSVTLRWETDAPR